MSVEKNDQGYCSMHVWDVDTILVLCISLLVCGTEKYMRLCVIVCQSVQLELEGHLSRLIKICR